MRSISRVSPKNRISHGTLEKSKKKVYVGIGQNMCQVTPDYIRVLGGTRDIVSSIVITVHMTYFFPIFEKQVRFF